MSTFNASIAVLLPLLYQSLPENSSVSTQGASFVCTLKLALEHVNTRNTCALKRASNRAQKITSKATSTQHTCLEYPGYNKL